MCRRQAGTRSACRCGCSTRSTGWSQWKCSWQRLQGSTERRALKRGDPCTPQRSCAGPARTAHTRAQVPVQSPPAAAWLRTPSCVVVSEGTSVSAGGQGGAIKQSGQCAQGCSCRRGGRTRRLAGSCCLQVGGAPSASLPAPHLFIRTFCGTGKVQHRPEEVERKLALSSSRSEGWESASGGFTRQV